MHPALTLIKVNRLKQSAVAAAIGISNSAFTNKATGREKFTTAQLAGIDAYLLNLYKSLGSYLNQNGKLETSLNLNKSLEAISPQASLVVDEPQVAPLQADADGYIPAAQIQALSAQAIATTAGPIDLYALLNPKR